MKKNHKTILQNSLFLLPWLIGILSFVAYPFAYSLYISFHEVKVNGEGTGLDYTYIGFDNFKYAFVSDNIFPVEMMLFFNELLFIVPLTVLFALLVAVLLNQKFKGRMFFRAIFFLPVIFATGQVLLELVGQGQGALPFDEQYDVTTIVYSLFPPSIAGTLVSLISKFVIILWYSGIQIIIFLAAFQTIPPSTFEAANIDGATPWESFWKITFPVIVPFIFLNLIYTLVEQSINPFNPVLRHIINSMSDIKTGYGYAGALGWIYFIIIMIPIVLLLAVAGRKNRRKA
ncbi:sugar ABC transporter permease [Paenibacillus sp. J5C_2022]|uniref:carbohydrate ABC transporter permease n=1 Tax=Paenibacillus sp. J5C2022 TaxID=2977129 RepID=UPI0021D0E81D|nr:sugar ABC transporter permease [Paenibacillus sp. J5C2022]MCU6710924.1 sugar ABC transporter permease [Paenibacillus sp. J5C2022]